MGKLDQQTYHKECGKMHAWGRCQGSATPPEPQVRQMQVPKPVTPDQKPVTPLPNIVTPTVTTPVTLPRRGKRGPAPQYGSSADRQRAYRARKRDA